MVHTAEIRSQQQVYQSKLKIRYRQEKAPPPEADEKTELTGLFLEKPDNTVAIAGKDVVFVAKVDSSTLVRKPTMKWLKGKWLDLGSKAGKHLQFKETYDRNTKVYTYEMKLVKVVPGDAGGYRCEVSAKEKCDSCTFEISVEATPTGEGQEEDEDMSTKHTRANRETRVYLLQRERSTPLLELFWLFLPEGRRRGGPDAVSGHQPVDSHERSASQLHLHCPELTQ
ncbi:hypothetical protein SRHO_G00048650 [Serrasalmus rhombeus]